MNRDLSSFFGGYPWSQTIAYSASLFSEEIRLASNFDGPLQFLAGFYYEEKETGFDSISFFGGSDLSLNAFAPGSVLLISNATDRNLKQKAFFGELTYSLRDNLKLTLGARVFDYDRDLVSQNFDAAFTPGGSPPSETSSSENDSSLKVGVEFTPSDDSLVYATWSEGFRLGYPEPASTLPASLCDPDGDGFFDGSNGISTGERLIESDFVENFELGSKLSLLEQRLTFNTAVYQINWDGIPIGEVFDFCSATANAGEARSRGVEMDLVYSVNENLLINFSSSYVDAELTEDSPAIGGNKGDRLPGSAKVNASFGVEYSFNVSDYDAYLRIDYSHVGGFHNNLQQQGIEAGDYNKVNIKSGMVINKFEVDLYVNNLTDDDSVTWVDSEGFPDNRRNRLRPRTVGLNVGYQF